MQLVRKLVVAGAIFSLVSGIAIAHEGASGMVMQRMEAMKDIGKSMKAIAAMVKGQSEFDGAKVEDAAGVIAKHAKHIPHMFPEGSLDKPTEALPVIWTQWDKFTALSEQMHKDALALAAAGKTAKSGRDILPQLGEVGKGCKACHQDFRLAK